MQPFKITCLRVVSETCVVYADNRDGAVERLDESTGAVIDVDDVKPITEEEAKKLLASKTVWVLHFLRHDGQKNQTYVFETDAGAYQAAAGMILAWLEERPEFPADRTKEIHQLLDRWRLREAAEKFNEVNQSLANAESVQLPCRLEVVELPVLRKI